MVGELRSGAEPPRGANLHIPKTRRPSLSATAGLPDGRLAQAFAMAALSDSWLAAAAGSGDDDLELQPRASLPVAIATAAAAFTADAAAPTTGAATALLLHFLPGAADRVVVGAANMAGVVGVVGV